MLFARDFLADQTIFRVPGAPERPQFSIILPTYRRCQSGQLARAIDSVLGQTFRDFELIVIDDGSRDGSAELIRSVQARDSRVVHVRHERNSGLPALRVNEGIELARARYFGFQFDDDAWLPHALATVAGEIHRSSAPRVIVGRAEVLSVDGEKAGVLPPVQVNLVSLYQQNRMANNAVFFPKEMVYRYGMYDCHVGLRRLCDWDLWLRYLKQAPFVVLDEIVSQVYVYNTGSVGVTVPWDLPLFYYLHGIPRDALLTPDHWREYEVDGLRIGEVEVEKDFRRRLYEDQIVPYYLRFRHHYPQVEGFPAFLPPEPSIRTVSFTKNDYDPCLDVALGHYDAPRHAFGRHKLHYQPLSQVSLNWTAETDLLVLARTVEDRAKSLLANALSQRMPIALYLDDDLLHFHEFGPQFDYLAPGTPYHQTLGELLTGVDAVWATTPALVESVRPYTARHVPHPSEVPADWLPAKPPQRIAGRPLKIGYVGTGYRLEEFRQLWDALDRISREYGDALTFDFWGLDVSTLPRLHSPVTQVAFTFSYEEYIHRLREAQFDLLLIPLLDHPRPRLAKTLIKYYETAVAGALGIFSDVPPYAALPDGLTCLKAQNTPDAWYAALHRAVTMPSDQFDQMRQRCVAHVREDFTAEVRLPRHEAALEATEFHARTREQRAEDGRPRVLYVLHSPYLGGAELQLLRRLYLAQECGVAPVLVLPRALRDSEPAWQLGADLAARQVSVDFADYTCTTLPGRTDELASESEIVEARALLERWQAVLVHTTTFNAVFGAACRDLAIPHVASLYQVPDTFSWDRPGYTHCAVNHSDTIRYARRWSQLLGSEPTCSRVVVPETLFGLGLRKQLESVDVGEPPPRGREVHLAAIGTVQPRKRQLETIEAVGRLRREGLDLHLHLYGYDHFFPDYLQECQRCVTAHHLENHVTFHGFCSDVGAVLPSMDAILSLSVDESFPGAVADAMAAGVLVVATPVGGIPELIVDDVSGILCAGTSVPDLVADLRRALTVSPARRRLMVTQAWRVARRELHPDRAARDLFAAYNRAIDITRGEAPARSRVDRASIEMADIKFPIHVGLPKSGRRVKSRLHYVLRVDYPNWTGLAVCLASIDPQASFKGSLTMTLVDLSHGPSGRVPLRTAEVRLEDIHNYGWAGFCFEPIENPKGCDFRVEFRLTSDDPATVAGLCILEATDFRTSVLRRVYHKYLRFGRGGRLACRLRVQSQVFAA